MIKLGYIWFALKVIFCGCQSDQQRNGFAKTRSDYKVSKIGRLPDVANESSGLALNRSRNSLWTHNDSGGKPELYEINYEGQLLSTRAVPHAVNKDWEDLAQSPDGTLYIGDMGNNDNLRHDLTIYSLLPEGTSGAPITFRYADQKDFPPRVLQFDCEAFFYYQDSLYLFSKNRQGSEASVKLYKVPARGGDYTLPVMDSLAVNRPVTAADINPSGTTFALLTYGKILLFGVENGVINFDHPRECIKIGKLQEEALVFLNDTDLLLTNEQRGLYLIKHR
jgi:hypothetical protein